MAAKRISHGRLRAKSSGSALSPPAGLKLEANCTLRDSIDMHFQLLAVEFGDSDVLVDGSAVERIDTAGLQLLLSFAKHQASLGKSLKWTAASPELVRGSQLLGLAGMLGLPDPDGGGDALGN
jgi:anti-anti-sigma regulatory factor